jgi:SAM-dependent methyltransferase
MNNWGRSVTSWRELASSMCSELGRHTLDESGLTQAAYDEYTTDYERVTYSLELFPGLEQEIERFHRVTPHGGPVLDLGCGVGRDSQYLLSRGRDVIAGDISPRMLQMTRQRCGDRLRPVRLDLTRLPFGDKSLAGVWACACVLHIPLRCMGQVFREIHRTLAPGGTAAISMKSGVGEGWRTGGSIPGWRWFTFVQPDDLAQLLVDSGFSAVTTTSSDRRDWYIAEAKKLTD